MKHILLSALLSVLCLFGNSQDLIKINGNVFEVEIISGTDTEVSFYDMTTLGKTFRTVMFKDIDNIFYKEWAEAHFSWRLKFNFTPYGSRHIIREYINERKSEIRESIAATSSCNSYGVILCELEKIKSRVPVRLGLNIDYCFTKKIGLGNLFEYSRTSYVNNFPIDFHLGVTTFSYTPHIYLSNRWHDFHLLLGPALSSHTFATYRGLRSNDFSMGLFTGIEVEGSRDKKSSVRFHIHYRFNEMVTIGPLNEILNAGKYKNTNVVIGLSFGGKFLESKKN